VIASLQTSAGHNTVDLGIEYNTHATAAWLALHLGLFEKHGIHVGKIVKFRTGLELAAAFSHGDIDAAWACLAPIVKMIDMGARIYIVNAAHYYGYGCVGRPGIESLAQLRGMRHVRVAVPGNGAPTHILALLAAEKYGLLRLPSLLGQFCRLGDGGNRTFSLDCVRITQSGECGFSECSGG